MFKHYINKKLILYLGVFALINILQSIFTPISKDEAYYWMFSQNLDWGYFDHPPMVAAVIWLGYLIFHNILGVRVITVILSMLTQIIIWFLIPKEQREKDKTGVVFALIVVAMPICHIYGFITTPDVPLLFFGSLYLLIFKKFISKPSIKLSVLLGIVAAMLMYSKYHGALIIIFSLLPYLKVLKEKLFYLSALIGIILFLPHIYWQYNHNFVTFIYHLNYRSDNIFLFSNIFEYLLNVILILNPFVSLFLFYCLIIGKVKMQYKSLIFIFWGFIAFFGLNSLKNHIEPHWIAIAIIPVIIFLHKIVIDNHKTKGIIIKLIYVSIPIVLLARVILILPLPLNSEFHKQGKDYYKTLSLFAKDNNVVFYDSYSHPAKYEFYTGKKAFATRSIWYHKTQYDLMDIQDNYNQKKAVCFKSNGGKNWKSLNINPNEKIKYRIIEKFPVINNLQANIESVEKTDNDTILRINFKVYNPYDYDIELKNKNSSYHFNVVKFCANGEKHFFPFKINTNSFKSNNTTYCSATFAPWELAVDDRIGVAIAPYKIDALLISNLFKLPKSN